MCRLLRSLAILLVCGAFGLGSAAAQMSVPTLTGRIVDRAGLIDGATTTHLESRLARLEAATGAQVAVLTIPTLEGDPIEDFGIRVVEAWKLGREGVDDGALFLVVPGDRKMRIEVGYGLEPTLTDAKSRRILDDIVTPFFRAGDMSGGIAAGVEAIAMVAEGSELPAPVRRRNDDGIPFFVMLMLFIGLILLTRFIRSRHDEVWTSDHGWGRRGGRGGWIIGGGGGGFSGGGGGFGGFSGGGGSFGGGGASGSW